MVSFTNYTCGETQNCGRSIVACVVADLRIALHGGDSGFCLLRTWQSHTQGDFSEVLRLYLNWFILRLTASADLFFSGMPLSPGHEILM